MRRSSLRAAQTIRFYTGRQLKKAHKTLGQAQRSLQLWKKAQRTATGNEARVARRRVRKLRKLIRRMQRRVRKLTRSLRASKKLLAVAVKTKKHGSKKHGSKKHGSKKSVRRAAPVTQTTRRLRATKHSIKRTQRRLRKYSKKCASGSQSACKHVKALKSKLHWLKTLVRSSSSGGKAVAASVTSKRVARHSRRSSKGQKAHLPKKAAQKVKALKRKQRALKAKVRRSVNKATKLVPQLGRAKSLTAKAKLINQLVATSKKQLASQRTVSLAKLVSAQKAVQSAQKTQKRVHVIVRAVRRVGASVRRAFRRRG